MTATACVQSQCGLRRLYYRDCVAVRLFAVTGLSFGNENKCRAKPIQSFVCVPASAVPDNKFITSEGNSCTDKNEIVEQFNKYFTNIGSCLNSKLPRTEEDPTQHIKPNTASLFFAPTDPTEIINIVKSANSSKSSGVDNIDP